MTTQDEQLQIKRAELWIAVAAARLHNHPSIEDATRVADNALKEFNQRFKPGTPGHIPTGNHHG